MPEIGVEAIVLPEIKDNPEYMRIARGQMEERLGVPVTEDSISYCAGCGKGEDRIDRPHYHWWLIGNKEVNDAARWRKALSVHPQGEGGGQKRAGGNAEEA